MNFSIKIFLKNQWKIDLQIFNKINEKIERKNYRFIRSNEQYIKDNKLG